MKKSRLVVYIEKEKQQKFGIIAQSKGTSMTALINHFIESNIDKHWTESLEKTYQFKRKNSGKERWRNE